MDTKDYKIQEYSRLLYLSSKTLLDVMSKLTEEVERRLGVEDELYKLKMGAGLTNASTPLDTIRKMAVAVVAENDKLRSENDTLKAKQVILEDWMRGEPGEPGVDKADGEDVTTVKGELKPIMVSRMDPPPSHDGIIFNTMDGKLYRITLYRGESRSVEE